MLIDAINSAAVIAIAVVLFPILKKHNEALALGYVASRIIESVILIVGHISLLSLLTLSQEYVQAGAPDASYFQTLGTLLVPKFGPNKGQDATRPEVDLTKKW